MILLKHVRFLTNPGWSTRHTRDRALIMRRSPSLEVSQLPVLTEGTVIGSVRYDPPMGIEKKAGAKYLITDLSILIVQDYSLHQPSLLTDRQQVRYCCKALRHVGWLALMLAMPQKAGHPHLAHPGRERSILHWSPIIPIKAASAAFGL